MGRGRYEEGDEFQIGAVGESDQRVMSAETGMAAATDHGESQGLETGNRAIQVGYGDHDVINSLEHRVVCDVWLIRAVSVVRSRL